MNHIIYNIILFSVLLVSVSLGKKKYTNKYFYFLPLLVLVFFSVIRYDVGPDYMSYVRAVNAVLTYGSSSQLDYILLSKLTLLFSHFSNTYLYVIGIYFILTVGLIFSRFRKEGFFTLSIFVFICFGIYFDSLDRIRQMLAIAVFFYSFRTLQNKEYFRFVFFCIMGIVSHASFIIIIPFYFLYLFKLNRYYLTIILSLIFFFVYIGFFKFGINYFLSYFPYYATKYMSSSFVSSYTGIGLGYLFRFIILVICVFYVRDDFIRNLVFFGALLYIVADGNLLILRMSSYLTFFVTLALPDIIARTKHFYIKCFICLLMFSFYQIDINRNHFDYQTFLSV